MTPASEAAGKRILVVDDDRNLRKIIATNLEIAGYDVTSVASGSDALTELDTEQKDLILLDVMMPTIDGYETARRIRQHPVNGTVPIIMLTAKGEVEDKVAGFDAGADDYLTKPFGPAELLARVRAKVRRVETDASLSPLTRLPGNLSIEAELRRRIADGVPFAVLYQDLDHFKAFNDVYGFTHGDEAIQLVASTTVDIVRRRGTTRDFVGHFGGDDFIIVTDPDLSEEIAREIIDEFDREIQRLYTQNDLRQGYIETRDRRGALNRFPIMSLSIAIVSSRDRELTNYAQIGEASAELKRYAKSIGGSVCVKDKRRK
ncbi:MAG: response regulator [Candidatus Eremiobacteraeota bacterium]|nr:response regulator [Candidatus Eremiobacteraeota bacterium]